MLWVPCNYSQRKAGRSLPMALRLSPKQIEHLTVYIAGTPAHQAARDGTMMS
tara:strand:+ start:384 stop:539 length:156 start_codon:yes stop_codon:yes gene_type:complete